MGEVIVMDNVSGLADKSNEFGSFLTLCGNFDYSCIYFLYIICQEKTIWQTIISQTKIFNIFCGSIQLPSVLKQRRNR